jgi:hypothetical protein
MIIAALSPLALADPGSCVRGRLHELIGDVRSEDWLSARDRQTITAIYADQTLTPVERAERSFDIYISARILGLSESDQSQIRNLIAQAQVKLAKSGMLGGSYSLFSKSINISLPDYAISNSVGKAILVHEIEHAIQDRAISGSSRLNTVLRMTLDQTEMRYLMEEGAMTSEFKYLHAIPAEEKAQFIREIQSQPSTILNRGSKKFIVRLLQNSDMDLDQYLAAERAAGRYSRKAIRIDRATTMAGPIIVAGGILGLTH